MRSNCLFEAIKAKLKNWNNIKIIPISKKIARGNCTHFIWYSKKNKTYSHFVWATEKHNSFYYEGKTVTISEKDFQRYIVERGIRLYNTDDNKKFFKFLKKWNIPFININGAANDFILMSRSFEQIPTKEEYDYLTDFFRKELPIKIVTTDNELKYTTFNKLIEMLDGTDYKFITPFDTEFRHSNIWESCQWTRVFLGKE